MGIYKKWGFLLTVYNLKGFVNSSPAEVMILMAVGLAF